MGRWIGSVAVTPTSTSRHDNAYRPRQSFRKCSIKLWGNWSVAVTLASCLLFPSRQRVLSSSSSSSSSLFRQSFPLPVCKFASLMEIQVVRDQIAVLRTQSQDALNGYPYRNDRQERYAKWVWQWECWRPLHLIGKKRKVVSGAVFSFLTVATTTTTTTTTTKEFYAKSSLKQARKMA